MADTEPKSEVEKKFSVTEVKDIEHFNKLLRNTNVDNETLIDQRVSDNLGKLVDRVSDSGHKLFFVQTNEGNWSVIGDSDEEVQQVRSTIDSISELQGRIDP